MKIAGEYTFDAPQELVWNALQDPGILGSVMPGGQAFEEVGENEYKGTIAARVGPVQGSFDGRLRLSDVVPPESYRISVDGKGAQGFVKGQGGLKLTAQGEQTHMAYEGDAQVGGRIASVGQRLIEASAKSIIRQSLEGLNAYLKVEVQKQAIAEAEQSASLADGHLGDGPPMAEVPPADVPLAEVPPTVLTVEPAREAEAPAYTPPSQTRLAMNVAADVAKEYIPAPYRPVVVGAAVALGVLALRRLLGR